MQTHFSKLLLAFIFVLSSTSLFATEEQKPLPRPRQVNEPYQIIVKYKNAPGSASMSLATKRASIANVSGVNVKKMKPMANGAYLVTLDKKTMNKLSMQGNTHPDKTIETILKDLNNDPSVKYAVRNKKLHTSVKHKDQWYEFSPPGGVALEGDNGAWQMTRGEESIIVAVVDTGIAHHSDLSFSILPGYSFVYNTTDNTDEGYGTAYHGTHVAGIVAANGKIKGIAPYSNVVPIQAMGDDGYGNTSDIINGIFWAAGYHVENAPLNPHPAKIINLSLGGKGACDALWLDAIEKMYKAGINIVVAAGNDNNDTFGYSPANCPHVISVAATNRHGERAFYSNYGRLITIAAPGGEFRFFPDNGILSTVKDGYAYLQGTSMATPNVAGIIALMYSVNPDLSVDQVKEILQQTATPFPASKDRMHDCISECPCGTGVANAAGAVAKAKALLRQV